MFMFAVHQFSSEHNEDSSIQKLQQMLLEQRENLTTLCTIVEYLKSYVQTGLDHKDVVKYKQKIQMMTDKQEKRYHQIDELINTNILELKKGKTADNTALIYGKEVRKIESGVRTLKLFASDAVNMLDLNKHLENRSSERIRYFDKRSTSLEAEIISLTKQLSYK
ncbi:chemotaxis protein [Solibacillus isronensis]|uniref:chemotaxis protein n=1 Tax=Solibacillus isronensis TaxID=412383 RepID=UPI0009A839BC|nr:chemotaxis protein [Solibacillus isronensis]